MSLGRGKGLQTTPSSTQVLMEVWLSAPRDHEDLTVRAHCCHGLFISQNRYGLAVRLEWKEKGGRGTEI